MTGPEHYREAENCANQAARAFDEGGRIDGQDWAALGSIHATLALAAATALRPEYDDTPWLEVTR